MHLINFIDLFKDSTIGLIALLVYSGITYAILQFCKYFVKNTEWRQYIPAIIFGLWFLISVFQIGWLPALIYSLVITMMSINFNEIIKFIINLLGLGKRKKIND